MTKFTDKGERFYLCPRCSRVGREGWAHSHTVDARGRDVPVNWYESVQALRDAEAESRKLVEQTVAAVKAA